MSRERRNQRWPLYDHRRRYHQLPGARVRCPSCGFVAVLISTDPSEDAIDALDALLESGCTGCPSCPGDLYVFIPSELETALCAPVRGLH